MEMNDVLKKLRKLQKLYESAKQINSEGEANAAAVAIQRMLTAYNLSMNEIGEDIDHSDDIIEENANGYTYKSIGGVWEYHLLYVLCKWNFCKCFKKKTVKNLVIFGKKENLETVKWLWDVLAERFVSFSKRRYKEYKSTCEKLERTPVSMDRFQRSYLVGCVNGLNDKLESENKRDKEADADFSTKVTALVVRNNAAIDEYISKKYTIKDTKAANVKMVTPAMKMGYEDGLHTNINKPISGGKTQTKEVGLLK